MFQQISDVVIEGITHVILFSPNLLKLQSCSSELWFWLLWEDKMIMRMRCVWTLIWWRPVTEGSFYLKRCACCARGPGYLRLGDWYSWDSRAWLVFWLGLFANFTVMGSVAPGGFWQFRPLMASSASTRRSKRMKPTPLETPEDNTVNVCLVMKEILIFLVPSISCGSVMIQRSDSVPAFFKITHTQSKRLNTIFYFNVCFIFWMFWMFCFIILNQVELFEWPFGAGSLDQ